MKKKIIVLSEYIGENHNSTAYYWSQIVKSLSDTYEVILIAPETNHATDFTTQYNVNFKPIALIEYDKNKLISRLWGQTKQTLAFMSVLYKELASCKLIFSGTNPIMSMLGINLLSKVIKFRWVLLVHDVFPNNLVPAKLLIKDSVTYKVLMAFSRLMYSSPDNLICIGRDMKKLLEDKVGTKASVEFIPNWASTEKNYFYPKSENKILAELGWDKNIVFQFFGNMGRLQGIGNLLDAIELSQHRHARFLFIGDGSELPNVQQKIKIINHKVGYKKIHYYGQLSLGDNLIGLNACDVAFVSLAKDMYGLGVPSKAYFSMAADKPILYVGDKESELSILLSEHDVGWFCEPDSPQKLGALIDKISAEYCECNVNKISPREHLIAHFSEGAALRKINKVVGGVIDL